MEALRREDMKQLTYKDFRDVRIALAPPVGQLPPLKPAKMSVNEDFQECVKGSVIDERDPVHVVFFAFAYQIDKVVKVEQGVLPRRRSSRQSVAFQ